MPGVVLVSFPTRPGISNILGTLQPPIGCYVLSPFSSLASTAGGFVVFGQASPFSPHAVPYIGSGLPNSST